IQRVREFDALLAGGTVREHVAELGALLNASHDSLREDYEVTVAPLDTAVDAARAAGAHGARMTGGGFGGSTIALVDAAQADEVASAIASAFAEQGFASPKFSLAIPAEGAGQDRGAADRGSTSGGPSATPGAGRASPARRAAGAPSPRRERPRS